MYVCMYERERENMRERERVRKRGREKEKIKIKLKNKKDLKNKLNRSTCRNNRDNGYFLL